jgi:nucleoside-diphosphate-sugar epimerase
MTVLVTGATGFIGRHLIQRLLDQDVPVRVVTRDPIRLPVQWRDRVEVVVGDLVDTEIQAAATKGVGLIYNLAGEIRDSSLMRAINVEAVHGLLETAAQVGVKRIVHLSSVGVIGASEAGVVTEDTPCRPQTLYEQSKLEGEQIVLEYAQSGRIEGVVLRPTIVFGDKNERVGDSLLEWLRALLSRRFVFIGKKGVANYIYVGDVVEALSRLAEVSISRSAVYIAADSVPMSDFVGAMAQALGVATPRARLPIWVASTLGVGIQLAGRVLGTPAPLTLSRVRALSSEAVFSGDKLFREAGVAFPFGYQKGLQLTVQWYRSVGRL